MGQGRSELAGERVQRWQADPAGAFRGQSVCVVGLRTESEGLKIQNSVWQLLVFCYFFGVCVST